MIIGSISENRDLEKRISITPEIAKKYINLGFKINLSENYGNHLGFEEKDDELYLIDREEKGADLNSFLEFKFKKLIAKSIFLNLSPKSDDKFEPKPKIIIIYFY